jgi:hypothetical protein
MKTSSAVTGRRVKRLIAVEGVVSGEGFEVLDRKRLLGDDALAAVLLDRRRLSISPFEGLFAAGFVVRGIGVADLIPVLIPRFSVVAFTLVYRNQRISAVKGPGTGHGRPRHLSGSPRRRGM